MKFKAPSVNDKTFFNKLASHPLQSWEWGEFRKSTGVIVERLISKTASYQVTFHQLPGTPFTIGYLPRSRVPSQTDLAVLKELGKKHKALFIKLEPNSFSPINHNHQLETNRRFLVSNGCKLGRPMFTNYSLNLDLNPSEDQLFSSLKSKTRYNVRLAQKKGVTVSIDDSIETFNQYIDLWKQTTKRQRFYSHTQQYHEKMWQFMHSTDIAHLLTASYQGKVLVAWILFVFNGVLYYPYGASSDLHRDLMASNLLMWEAIKFGKSKKCTSFDMWGSLGPNPKPTDPWYGFHRFKQGYGGELVEFVGSYDLVINPLVYPLFKLIEKIRWFLLRNKP
jgi:lipid II:glycine glycyltransferase (peptidoglycan interpeptide bridge formation enzyme)